MCTRAYIAASCIGDMTTLHVGHIGPEDPRLLCNLPECLSVHAWPWNPEVLATALCDKTALRLQVFTTLIV